MFFFSFNNITIFGPFMGIQIHNHTHLCFGYVFVRLIMGHKKGRNCSFAKSSKLQYYHVWWSCMNISGMQKHNGMNLIVNNKLHCTCTTRVGLA